jgi:hypothetical protein
VKSSNIKERVERRKKAWEGTDLKNRKGYKAPGSNKKSFPKGSGR